MPMIQSRKLFQNLPKAGDLTTKDKTTSDKHKTFTKAIGRFIVKDLRPFSIVSNEGFKDMIKQLDPKSELPSRTYFAETVVPNMYQECRAYVISSLKNVPPAIYAVLVAKEIRSNVNDISTLSEADITIAEDIVACLSLKAITTVLYTEKMPTVSIILPLQKKLLTSVLVSKEMDSDVIKQMKNAMASDLDSRLATEAASLKPQPQLPVSLKVEQSTSTPTVTDLPALPDLPDVESTDLQSDVNLVDDVKFVTAITTKITSDLTTQSGCASGGLASILGDVAFIKEVLPQKSNLEQAIFEIDVFKGQALIPVSEDSLIWWKGHQWQFPLLSQLARKRLCIPATSVPSELARVL
ncbi:uncharacterized protein LOC121369822 [Gigantopelta aegis]|uniref:uncharacterized protein LOC121369822 n=1 Tax=Gigantopelta aegis TaxID=1735272 RepID=UPI001B888BED|nr:uncharacterized protein LOC121369822 [Gigantopelta aegis]